MHIPPEIQRGVPGIVVNAIPSQTISPVNDSTSGSTNRTNRSRHWTVCGRLQILRFRRKPHQIRKIPNLRRRTSPTGRGADGTRRPLRPVPNDHAPLRQNNLLHMIDVAKNCIHPKTRLWVNIGDTDLDTFKELKKAGVSGAYHVCRLREGIDTKLKPEARLQTMRNILAAGIELQTCCEPIGPEHTVEEVVDNFFIGINMGATSRACMRRTPVPGTPFENSGQISQLRLAQFCAVISLAAPQVKGCNFTSVHEPNQAGFISGANLICAESGANPRDTTKNTQENLGWTTGRCRKLLLESGFSHLRLGDDSLVPLTLDYLERTNSL